MKKTEGIKMLRKSLSTKQPITPVIGFHVALSKDWSGSEKKQSSQIMDMAGTKSCIDLYLKCQLEISIS